MFPTAKINILEMVYVSFAQKEKKKEKKIKYDVISENTQKNARRGSLSFDKHALSLPCNY